MEANSNLLLRAHLPACSSVPALSSSSLDLALPNPPVEHKEEPTPGSKLRSCLKHHEQDDILAALRDVKEGIEPVKKTSNLYHANSMFQINGLGERDLHECGRPLSTSFIGKKRVLGKRKSVSFEKNVVVHEFSSKTPGVDDFFAPLPDINSQPEHSTIIYQFHPENFSRISAVSPSTSRMLPKLVEQNPQNLSLVALSCRYPRIIGMLNVKNICFNKEVFIQYTMDNWKTIIKHKAEYALSIDDYNDIFIFRISPQKKEHLLKVNKIKKLEFCFCVKLGNGEEFWDSNNGDNFKITIVKTPHPLARSRSF